MKTITITIQVPDGVNVAVSQGAQQAQQQRPFVERPAPPQPAGGCPEHGTVWQLVPAGISKKAVNADGSPKRYNAFWTCPERGCNQMPPRDAPAVQYQQSAMVDISEDGLPF
jgi:hypothetical protein